MAERTEDTPYDVLRSYVTLSSNPMVHVLPDGTVAHANAAGEALLRLLGSEVGARLPEAFRGPFEEALREGSRWRETPLCTELGDFALACAVPPDRAYVNLYIHRLESPPEAVISFQDIFDLLARMSFGVLVVGPDRRIVRANEAFHRMLRHNEALVGLSFGEIVYPQDADEAIAGLNRLFEGETEYVELEFRFHAKFGRPTWTRVRAIRLDDEDESEGPRVLMAAQDLSELVRTENELQIARRRAERAQEAKSRFLSRMSHEFRTPMNSILGFAQLLQLDPNLSEESKERASLILKSGRRLFDMLEEVLDFALVESGRFTLSTRTFPVAAAVEEAIQNVQGIMQTFDVEVVNRVTEAEGPVIVGDFERVVQVFTNLISNGIRFNRPGGSVTIECEEVTAETVVVSIADTGVGIPEERWEELFEPFSKFETGDTEDEGSGVGLALTKLLVEAMGGYIGLESEPDVGTTFYIGLPRAADEAAGEEAPLRSESVVRGFERDTLVLPDTELADTESEPPPEEEEERSRKRVLYVEDNPENLELVSDILKLRPHIELLTAMDAPSGIQIAQTEQPDLIILDINLPGMDGLEAVQHLKRGEVTQDIPVVALSAAAMPQDIEAGLKVGFERYLTKPIEVSQFLATLDEYLGNPDEGEES